MKILLVIHGYPMRYNAGSEVYTQNLAQALSDRHEVHIFTRQENTFIPEFHYSKEKDPADSRVTLHLVNIARGKDRYRYKEVDNLFGTILDRIKPDVVHIGHLNHLSTSLVLEASDRCIPTVFTLHDYWLMCPRGQFIQMYPNDGSKVWTVCSGQQDDKCAEICYARYFSGDPQDREADVAYWIRWVRRRMSHIHEVCQTVDAYIAPSMYLLHQFNSNFGIPKEKLIYLDYGFNLAHLNNRIRTSGEPFTFGYIGTHIPAKGVHHLIQAFSGLDGDVLLRIWGRHRVEETSGLQAIVDLLPKRKRGVIEWMGEYCNRDIVSRVFNACDAIVVPSIWAENSPLVIHEALQARVPVITANYGGMAEYVKHEVNGLLFDHRDPNSLRKQMKRLLDDPELAKRLGARGYWQSSDGNVPELSTHVRDIEKIYQQLRDSKNTRQNELSWNRTSWTMEDHIRYKS